MADLGALFGAGTVDTFLGLERATPEAASGSSAFLGAPCATPYQAVGAYAAGGPASIRAAAASLAANVDRHNFDLGGPTFPGGTQRAVDCGDLGWSETDFAANRAGVSGAVTALLGRGVVPIVIGGDDSIPIPMLQALGSTGEHYTILQIDAHIDWREVHMDERMGLSSTMRRASEMAHIERIIQVGARGIGSGHSDDLADALAWGAYMVPAVDLHRDGVAPVLELIPEGANVVICFDIDALDPSIAPNTIGRAPGGLTFVQAMDLIRGASERGRIAAADFTEILPEADIDGIGALHVSRLITNLMGLIARQQAG